MCYLWRRKKAVEALLGTAAHLEANDPGRCRGAIIGPLLCSVLSPGPGMGVMGGKLPPNEAPLSHSS